MGSEQKAAMPDWSQYHSQVLELLRVPYLVQGEQPWHEARARMTITGSDAAAVLEDTPYKSPFKSRNQLFMEKTGQKKSGGGGWAAAHGTKHEAEALLKYNEVTGAESLIFGLIPHPRIEWMGASPDAITTRGRMVEIKVFFF